MKYILFSDLGYKIIETQFIQHKEAPNGRIMNVFSVDSIIKKYGKCDDLIKFTSDLSRFPKDSMFPLNDNSAIFDFIFNKFTNWWEKK